MDNYLSIMGMRAQYRAGMGSDEDAATYAADVAFDSGLVGEAELTMTALVYTIVTDKAYIPDDWA